MSNLTIYRCLECRELIEDKDLLLSHVKSYSHTKGFEEVEIPIITEKDKTIKKVASEIAGSFAKPSIQEVPKLLHDEVQKRIELGKEFGELENKVKEVFDKVLSALAEKGGEGMTEVKVCPIFTIGKDKSEYCTRSFCAWWDSENDQCVLLTLVRKAKGEEGVAMLLKKEVE
jgi:hypothetical protein